MTSARQYLPTLLLAVVLAGCAAEPNTGDPKTAARVPPSEHLPAFIGVWEEQAPEEPEAGPTETWRFVQNPDGSATVSSNAGEVWESTIDSVRWEGDELVLHEYFHYPDDPDHPFSGVRNVVRLRAEGDQLRESRETEHVDEPIQGVHQRRDN